MNDFYKLLEKLKKVRIDTWDAAKGDPEKEKLVEAEDKKILGAEVLHNRKHVLRLTQEELAQKIGVTKMQIIRWERGDSMPSKLAKEKLKKEGLIK